nr:family 1 glycosylhydrolase [Microbacterium halimionae]
MWGAATAAHQVEGGNTASDWWAVEQGANGMLEPSGDGLDSYHRYPEDMRLLAEAGLDTYRFSIEWARIEPEPGVFSADELAHYRGMIDEALRLGLTPVVTLHHFTHPLWFVRAGGWRAEGAIDAFRRYVDKTCEILEGVEWVCTINEPAVLTLMIRMHEAFLNPAQHLGGPRPSRLPLPDLDMGRRLGEAHVAARKILRARTDAKIGWTIAMQALTPTPGNEDTYRAAKYAWEDIYLEHSRDDDFIGVQSYTSQLVDAEGVVPHPPSPDNTLTGWAYRPDALGMAVRDAAAAAPGVPILITENGIATDDDDRRIAYTAAALDGLFAAMADGIDVRGYLHWSLLDNYEWGHWGPTFGLIAVDRATFARAPKPSLAWLGSIARGTGSHRLPSTSA